MSIAWAYWILSAADGLTVPNGPLLMSSEMSAFWAVFAALNVTTLLTYGYDKYNARTGGRRVRESTLHILAATGGTPGAFVGQLLFRHKTRDRRFRLVFWVIAVTQVVVLVAVVRMCWL